MPRILFSIIGILLAAEIGYLTAILYRFDAVPDTFEPIGIPLEIDNGYIDAPTAFDSFSS